MSKGKNSVTLKEYVLDKFDSAEHALELAFNHLNSRLEGMNDFRQQLQSQTATFITRNEHDDLIKKVDVSIKELKEADNNFINRAEHEALTLRLTSDIQSLRESRAEISGKASQNSFLITLGVSLVSLIVSMVMAILYAIKK